MVSIENYMNVSQCERQSKMDGTFTNWKNEDMHRQSRANWKADKTMNNTKTQWKDKSETRKDEQSSVNYNRQSSNNSKASITNNTRSNWRETYTRTKDRQVKRDSQENVRSINKENNTNVKAQKILKAEELQTLDKFFGKSFKPISVEGGLEGSEPPKYLDPDLEQYMEEEFEINEADEDIYSESNTLTNFNQSMMSHRNYKVTTKEKSNDQHVKTSFIDENRSINNETVIMNVEEKIKRKIIEKYSKNPRQKITQMSAICKSEQPQIKFLDLAKTQFEQNQIAAANAAKSHSNINQIDQTQPHRKNQASSQSPGKQESEYPFKADTKQGLRGSLTNFYQKTTNHGCIPYEDGKSIENHIAFRNSFYAQNTQKLISDNDIQIAQNTQGISIFKNNQFKAHKEDSKQFQQQRSITKIEDYIQKQGGPPDISKFTDMPIINKHKQYNQKEKINEIKAKEQDKYTKYASRFNLVKSDVRDRSNEQANQRMQTPTLYFQSDFKKNY